MKAYFFIIFLLITGLESFSQKKDSLSYDTSGSVILKKSENIHKFLKDETFRYENEIAESPVSLQERILKWISELITLIQRGGKPVSYAFYVVLFIVLLLAIMKLLGMNYRTLFIKSAKIKTDEIDIFQETEKDIDIEKIIIDSIENKNYRKSIRYLYIKFLKQLVAKEIIEWKINKTNRDYRNELKNTKHIKAFKRLTMIYEHVWYGEFTINEEQFYLINYNFDKAYKSL